MSGDADRVLEAAESGLECGDPAASQNLAAEARSLYQKDGDENGEADAIHILIHTYRYQSRISEAETTARDALSVFKAKGNRRGEAKMKLALAEVIYKRKGKKVREEALQLARDSVQVFRELADVRNEAYACCALTNGCLVNEGDSEEAFPSASRAYDLFSALQDLKGQAVALHCVAAVHMEANEHEKAMKKAKLALDKFNKLGFQRLAAYENQCISEWSLKAGLTQDAVTYAQDAVQSYKSMKAPAGPSWEVSAMATLVKALIVSGQDTLALDESQSCLQRFSEQGNQTEQIGALDLVTLCHISQGNLQDALGCAKKALSMLAELDQPSREADLRLTLANLHFRSHQYQEAMQHVAKVVSHYTELDEAREVAVGLQLKANILIAENKLDNALMAAKDAHNLFKKVGMLRSCAIALLVVCKIYCLMSNFSEAASCITEAQGTLRRTKARREEAEALRISIEVHRVMGKHELVLRAAERAVSIYQDLGDKKQQAHMLVLAAQTYVVLLTKHSEITSDVLTKALTTAQEAVAVAAKLGDEPLAAAALGSVASVHLLNKRPENALQQATQALVLLRKIGDRHGEAFALTTCANAHLMSGRKDKSSDMAKQGLSIFKLLGDTEGESMAKEVLEILAPDAPYTQVLRGLETPETGEVSTALDSDLVKSKILEITRRILGKGEELTTDSALMLIDINTETSVLLRDAIVKEFPGIPLPTTLVPDCPTISSIADEVVRVDRTPKTEPILPRDVVQAKVLHITKQILGDDMELENDTPLAQSGMNSSRCAMLRDYIAQEFPGINVSSTLVFDYPTINAISAQVAQGSTVK